MADTLIRRCDCGKFMKYDGITISSDWTDSRWSCRCGNKVIEGRRVEPLFSKDAIVFGGSKW